MLGICIFSPFLFCQYINFSDQNDAVIDNVNPQRACLTLVACTIHPGFLFALFLFQHALHFPLSHQEELFGNVLLKIFLPTTMTGDIKAQNLANKEHHKSKKNISES